MMLNFCNIICLIIIIATDDLFAGLWDSTVSEVDMLQLPIFCLVNLSCQSLRKLYYYYYYYYYHLPSIPGSPVQARLH